MIKISHQVSSLNDYIQLIKNNELNAYYYRGENKKHPSISSSLLRKNLNALLKNKQRYFYEDLINEYYSEIATNITDLERNNFIAFNQHHGLVTNLLDLTESPLVALFLLA